MSDVLDDADRRPADLAAAPRGKGPRWRRRLALALAVLLPPLLVRGCVLDDYVIESGSMEPAFCGAADGGDHLLVLRRGCDTRPVQRWDVAVIDGSVDPELPHDIHAMLKRVVGLPGESLFIANGDVYVTGAAAPRLLRKPDDLIATLLVPMVTTAGLQAPWTWVGPGERQDLPGGGTRVAATGSESGTAVFESLLDDGLPGRPGETPVADTALEVEVGSCDGVLELQLREGSDVFTARLAPSTRGGAWLHHNLGGVVATAPDFPGLKPGQTVLMWNVDNGVRLRIDGRTLLSWDYDSNGEQIAGAPARNDPWLAVEGGAMEILRVTVLRDLHYLAQGVFGADAQAPFHVPGGHLFMLGDHSRQSRDSRFFGPVPVGAVRGRPLAIYSPWRRARCLQPGGQPW